MSLTGAEKHNDTGCWQAAAQGRARSFRAVYLTEVAPAAVRDSGESRAVKHRASLYSSSFGHLAFIHTLSAMSVCLLISGSLGIRI